MGYTSDDEEECERNGRVVADLLDAIWDDDKEKFLQYLAHPSSEAERPFILSTLIIRRAVNCAKAVLAGEACVIVDDINAPMPEYSHQTPLHAAALVGCPEMLTLFLQHGASPNLRCIDSSYYSKMLPINLALHMMARRFYVKEWTVKMSVFNLIIRLLIGTRGLRSFVFERGTLQCIKLLTSTTEGIDDEIYHYALEGRVVELAALMLADHEKVLALVQRTCCSDHGSESSTLHCLITAETALLSTMGTRLKHTDKYQLRQACQEKLLVRMRTLQLFEVFRSAGHQLAAYLHSKKSHNSPQQVVEEVAWILKKAGFALKDEDLDWSVLCEASLVSTFLQIDVPLPRFDSDLSNYMEQVILKCPHPKGNGESEQKELGLLDLYKRDKDARPYEQWRFATTKHLCGSHSFFVRNFEGSPVWEDILMISHDSNPIFQLKEAIEKFCSHQYLKDWSCKMSIFKLLYILFLPELENELNDIRHACESSTIDKIALLGCYYVKEGKIIELATLLRAGQKKLISRTGSQRADECLKIYKCIMSEIRTMIDEEISSMRKSSYCKSVKDKRMLLSSTFLLLEVFEGAGHQLEAYIRFDGSIKRTTNEQIAKDFRFLFRELGFVLSSKDFDVRHFSCLSSKFPEEKAGLEISVPNKIGPSAQACNSIFLKKIGVPHRSPHVYNPVQSFHTLRISQGNSDLVFSSPLAIRANKIGIKSHLPSSNFPLGGKWASRVFAVIRSLKHV